MAVIGDTFKIKHRHKTHVRIHHFICCFGIDFIAKYTPIDREMILLKSVIAVCFLFSPDLEYVFNVCVCVCWFFFGVNSLST